LLIWIRTGYYYSSDPDPLMWEVKFQIISARRSWEAAFLFYFISYDFDPQVSPAYLARLR
jgi:hypothetical protein